MTLSREVRERIGERRGEEERWEGGEQSKLEKGDERRRAEVEAQKIATSMVIAEEEEVKEAVRSKW